MNFFTNKWVHLAIAVVAVAAPVVAPAVGAGELSPFLQSILALVAGGSGATAAHQNAVGK